MNADISEDLGRRVLQTRSQIWLRPLGLTARAWQPHVVYLRLHPIFGKPHLPGFHFLLNRPWKTFKCKSSVVFHPTNCQCNGHCRFLTHWPNLGQVSQSHVSDSHWHSQSLTDSDCQCECQWVDGMSMTVTLSHRLTLTATLPLALGVAQSQWHCQCQRNSLCLWHSHCVRDRVTVSVDYGSVTRQCLSVAPLHWATGQAQGWYTFDDAYFWRGPFEDTLVIAYIFTTFLCPGIFTQFAFSTK